MKRTPSRRLNVLITAGPTREWMDPVRFLSNPSTGKMGLVLADVLAQRGADVTLVLGPTPLQPSQKIKTIRVESALQMARAVKKNSPGIDAFIGTAAVGDWRFKAIRFSKIKKTKSATRTVALVKNPDILASVRAPIKIGFSLETAALRAHAEEKLRKQNLDLIIANEPASFGHDSIRGLWIERAGQAKKFPSMTKKTLSRKIAQWLELRWKKKISKHLLLI